STSCATSSPTKTSPRNDIRRPRIPGRQPLVYRRVQGDDRPGSLADPNRLVQAPRLPVGLGRQEAHPTALAQKAPLGRGPRGASQYAVRLSGRGVGGLVTRAVVHRHPRGRIGVEGNVRRGPPPSAPHGAVLSEATLGGIGLFAGTASPTAPAPGALGEIGLPNVL